MFTGISWSPPLSPSSSLPQLPQSPEHVPAWFSPTKQQSEHWFLSPTQHSQSTHSPQFTQSTHSLQSTHFLQSTQSLQSPPSLQSHSNPVPMQSQPLPLTFPSRQKLLEERCIQPPFGAFLMPRRDERPGLSQDSLGCDKFFEITGGFDGKWKLNPMIQHEEAFIKAMSSCEDVVDVAQRLMKNPMEAWKCISGGLENLDTLLKSIVLPIGPITLVTLMSVLASRDLPQHARVKLMDFLSPKYKQGTAFKETSPTGMPILKSAFSFLTRFVNEAGCVCFLLFVCALNLCA
jgi:hypothetical protein